MVILETSVFTRQVREWLSDEEYLELQMLLVRRPTAGSVIRGSGGLRKIRWTLPGRGKRGGVRVVYYWAGSREQLLMLFIYRKSEREDLTTTQLKVLMKIVGEEYP